MKIDHMLLMASDLDASVRHYDALLPALGFSRTREWVWTSADGALSLDLRQAEDGAGYRRRGPGVNHFAFAAESEAEFESMVAAVGAAGVTVPEEQRFGPARAHFIPDPDGLRMELIWDPEA